MLATPPDEFVAARNALVKELKAKGQRDEAAEVAGLRRPSWVDWALNMAAVDHAGEIARFVDAAELMRDAQRGAVTGRGDVDLRAAMTGLRDRTGELARCVNRVLTGHGRPPALPEITERLAEIATSDRSADRLRAGLLLGDAGEDVGLGFGDVDERAAPSKPKPTKKAATKKNKTTTKKTAPVKQENEAPADLSLERRRIERDLKTADRVSKAARRDADRADTAVRHAKAAADAATDAVNQAQAALDRAQRRLVREQADRDGAHARAEAAAAELERLRKALDDL